MLENILFIILFQWRSVVKKGTVHNTDVPGTIIDRIVHRQYTIIQAHALYDEYRYVNNINK